MKKKLIKLIMLSSLFALMLTGCDKKGGSISENLINDDPTAISMTGVTGMASVDTSETVSEDEAIVGLYTDPVTDSEESSLLPGQVAYEDAINPTGESVSDDSVSQNEASSVSENMTEGETDSPAPVATPDVMPESVPVPNEPNAPVSVYEDKRNNNITIINISGKDYANIYVTFSVGSMVNMDILGLDELKDGQTYVYSVTDMSPFYSVYMTRLTVTAETKKGETIDFGEIEILDPDAMNIVLSASSTGYYMYIE